MAPTLRPLHSNPREPSSRPLRSTRKRVRTYREDSSDNDLSFLDDTDSYSSDPFRSSTRRRSLTYRGDLAAGHLSKQLVDAAAESGSSPPPLVPGKVTRSSSARAKRSLFSKSSQQSSQTSSHKKQRQRAEPDATHLAPSGATPPWQKLPYHILLNIFNHAFSPSTPRTLSDLTKSVRWLLSTSRLCREFLEPAITTLYYSPPLFPPSRLMGLVHLLERPQETLYTNYRNKIKRLDILFGHYHVRHLDLGQLIALTPQLQHLRLHDATQLAMPSSMNVKQRLNTWEKFLDALDANNIRLRSWAWNGELLLSSPRFQPQKIAAVHRRPAFTNLRSLQFLNLPPSSSISGNTDGKSDEDQGNPGELFASALSLLAGLQELEFNRCYNVDDNFLSYLDLNLRSLKLVNCENVTSANLATLLAHRGHSLRELVLEHNRYLNMSFTTNLATSCPHLEAFTLDLNFTSPASFIHDVDPYFDELLHDSEVPSWPASLQILKLERLRKWEISMAMLFFDSLIHSAPYLPNLRVLQLSAILKIGWRDRASFRREWVGKLERTYRRCSPPPNQHSKPTPNGQTAKGHTNRARSRSFSNTTKDLPVPRHSTRIAQQRSIETNDNELRIIAKQNDPQADCAGKEEFIHGMCDVVEIRVDNLRPADYLLTNDNFEDDDTDDEDWSGRDPVEVDRYAW
ncbi:hypothetical protein ACJ73_06550 [Blastomyces percursus]|uniref:Uncharacterized protein n=1 Tax=Blastomyces percursus TaxID=1658174 RepID=A0A1J9R282_9EURO|nr:hypothetical protein ACJ73_06550 [Blastomyces percursus]